MRVRQDSKLNTHRSTHSYLSELCVPVASASGRQHLRSASTVLLQVPIWSPNHNRPAELRNCRIISVEQSSCCSMETRDDTFKQQLSVCSTSDVLWTKEHSSPPGAIVAFSWFWHWIQKCRLTYLQVSSSGTVLIMLKIQQCQSRSVPTNYHVPITPHTEILSGWA